MDSTDDGPAVRTQPGWAPRRARWLAAFTCLVLLAAIPAWTTGRPGTTAAYAAPAGRPSAQPSPHAWTRSYYVANSDPAAMNHLGCLNTDTSGRMTLFFGAPTSVGGDFGATLWGGANRTVRQIGESIKDFVRGYAWCRQGGRQALVAMGTSNSGLDNKSDRWIAGHGNAWADVVRSVAAWVEATFPGVARVYGAWDAEPSWSVYGKADMWMQGYNGVPGNRPVHAHFSADGCPRATANGGACNNGWSQAGVWRLAWWYDPALPMPQIYATSGVNARQWQKIDEYGARHQGDGMVFSGLMTQHRACQQRGGCSGISNLPHQGHDQLLWTLNTSPLTSQPSLGTVTDIEWHAGGSTRLSAADPVTPGGAGGATGRSAAVTGIEVLGAEIDALLGAGLAPDHPKVTRLRDDLAALGAAPVPPATAEPGVDLSDVLGTPPGLGARSAGTGTATATAVAWDRGTVDCEPLPPEILPVDQVTGAHCLVAPRPDGTSRYVAVAPGGTVRVVRFGGDGSVTRAFDRHVAALRGRSLEGATLSVTGTGDLLVSVAASPAPSSTIVELD